MYNVWPLPCTRKQIIATSSNYVERLSMSSLDNNKLLYLGLPEAQGIALLRMLWSMLCKGKALCMPHSVNGIDEGDFLCQHISIYLAALINKHFLDYMYLWNVCYWQNYKCIRKSHYYLELQWQISNRYME